ncbi:RraA family protein [Xylanibacillus composti]|uniref:Putative 4-hydroxy-4-methyl-2-oxoglutarate aldolase n=1 Tax=Xylanibacillus composti TaxID=1572762 RepID=A0A8J4M2F8_9BACL|nr:RraA family protein [Xylanibacillus composti]MDT9727102.1 RraA family protein [Xylanibacillus composti]GIQ68887.1 methyltransferase [Xylanibacillus composti]
MVNYGFRVLPLTRRPDSSLIQQCMSIATPLLSDNMHRVQGTIAGFVPYHRSAKLAGAAFTVRTRPGDNLMVHKAIDMAEPGDVIVVDACGELSQAILGEIMLRLAEKRGIAGFVIDGAIRDSAAFRERDYPCFARGTTHRGPYKEGPGEINVPVTIGRMPVMPGDLIVGDEDGIVAIPLDYAAEVVQAAQRQLAREQRTFEEIAEGSLDRSWVDEALKRKGCELP